ncbi:MAG: GYF domain-containing protein [Bryobacteraceae bacterium]|nr:GYF domain-containing protein [Bryobacteraceae bacterium]
MKTNATQKEKRKNYNSSSKRGVSYVPKPHRGPDSSSNTSSASSDTPTMPKAATQPADGPTSGSQARREPTISISYGKLTKQAMMTLYSKCPALGLIQENIKQYKDVYSEESLVPESFKEFTLPMSKAIMPPRKLGGQGMSYADSRGQYGAFRESRRADEADYNIDSDQGILTGTDNNHVSMSNAPLWFDNDSQPQKSADPATKEMLSMEELAGRQASLEEEKAKFMAGSKPNDPIKPRADIESVLNKVGPEFTYSSVDEKLEKVLKKSIERDLFGSAGTSADSVATDVSKLKINAIDGESLEARMIKEAATTEEPEDKEERPVWDTFSAEEIKQHTEKHMRDQGWGLTLDQTKDGLLGSQPGKKEGDNGMFATKPDAPTAGPNEPQLQPYVEEPIRPIAQAPAPPPEPLKNENKNPFCHSSLGIKETDRVWFYKDIQNCLQGPFTSIEMYMWYKAGYFFADLPVQCGEGAAFIPLGEFLESTKPRPRPAEPVQHFDRSNMAQFFDPALAYADSARPPRVTSPLEEPEGNGYPRPAAYPAEPDYRGGAPLERARSEPTPWQAYPYAPRPAGRYPGGYPQQQQQYYQTAEQRPYARPAPQPQYFKEDPAIASARIGGSAEGGQMGGEPAYVTDSADDLKALLGMPSNNTTKNLYR